MKFKTLVAPIIFSLIIGATIVSCTHDKGNITKQCESPEIVSFNQDILPVLNTQCSIGGCHTSAAHAGSLNLEATVAYSKLLHPGSGYVDTLNPTFSILYSSLISTSNPMPPSGNLSDCKIQLVLKWINQKAKNN